MRLYSRSINEGPKTSFRNVMHLELLYAHIKD
jgi:hypothetical protein